MADFAALQAEIDKLAEQVAATETVEASATNLINGFAAQITEAVTAALTADNAADANSIAAATAAIDAVRARFSASAGALGDAVASVPPPA